MFACPPPPPVAAPDANRPRYVVNVRVSKSFQVSGDLTVTFKPNRATDRLVFRLWPNGPRQLEQGSRLDVGAFTSPGRDLTVARPDPTTVVVRLSKLDAGDVVQVHVPWRLRVPPAAVDRISRYRSGLRLGSFFPILAWDPRRGWVTDRPARILGESSTSPTADFHVRVQTPPGLTAVVSHGRAVRDIAVAVGRFRVATGVAHTPTPVRVRVAIARGAGGDARAFVRLAVRALEQLSRRYGPYPWPTYSIVVPADFRSGGIEYPTLSYVGSGAFVRAVIDHETAHQWFYSLVGNNQARDPWLDETLATWAQQRIDALFRPKRPRLPRGVVRHVGAAMTYWARFPRGYFYGVYEEGANALRSLGDNARVDCALRAYAARRAYAIARPGDLLDELNRLIPGAERRLAAWGIHR
jgi:hypothetical protein